ncbi:MAG: branched-chain amino acid ABC transporter permease, partial [Methylobacteriaceae bacterium]|nr:branched-chain amino acid ABC transporter permease [Methylobacteriaceae bacterium]
LLRRYYLDAPEATLADPGPPPAERAALPRLPGPLAFGLQLGLGSLPRVAIYGLLAAAYALVFGLVGRINLAFGEIAAVGAAGTGLVSMWLASGALVAAPPILVLATLVGITAAAAHGLVAGRVAFAHVPPARVQASLIATVGLALALSEYLRLVGGERPAWIPPFGAGPVAVAAAEDFTVTTTTVSLVVSATGVMAALALALAMRLSRFGRDWRAQADDPVGAALCGIDGARLLGVTLAAAGGLAGLAGALAAIQYGALGYAGGFGLGLKALAAAVLGGVGSVGGALLGGLAIGVVETIWSATLPIDGRDIGLYGILVGAIVLRPHGLLGQAPPRERP